LTVIEVLKAASGHLQKHSSDSARLDAEVLLAQALGMRRLDLYLQFDRPLTDDELTRYRGLIKRRAHGDPVAYLVGHKEFMALDFEVTPAVLVPNPDTEVLVQRAVALAREADRPLRVADAGTGSAIPGDLRSRLRRFLDASRDPNVPLVILGYAPLPVSLTVIVDVLDDHGQSATIRAAQAALSGRPNPDGSLGFFARLGFGDSVALSSIYAVTQAVDGVRDALVSAFDLNAVAPAPGVRDTILVRPTELVTLDAADLRVTLGRGGFADS